MKERKWLCCGRMWSMCRNDQINSVFRVWRNELKNWNQDWTVLVFDPRSINSAESVSHCFKWSASNLCVTLQELVTRTGHHKNWSPQEQNWSPQELVTTRTGHTIPTDTDNNQLLVSYLLLHFLSSIQQTILDPSWVPSTGQVPRMPGRDKIVSSRWWRWQSEGWVRVQVQSIKMTERMVEVEKQLKNSWKIVEKQLKNEWKTVEEWMKTHTRSNPWSLKRLPSTSPIPAKSVTGLSPMGSDTKLWCFCDVVDILTVELLSMEKKRERKKRSDQQKGRERNVEKRSKMFQPENRRIRILCCWSDSTCTSLDVAPVSTLLQWSSDGC